QWMTQGYLQIGAHFVVGVGAFDDGIDMSTYLEVPLGHPLMVYRYTAHTTGQQPVLHGATVSRADRFCYSLSTRSGQ
ncbi:MAG: hypothetical protein AAFW95_11170, partial [Cyanobacteria bacterium J06638_6]